MLRKLGTTLGFTLSLTIASWANNLDPDETHKSVSHQDPKLFDDYFTFVYNIIKLIFKYFRIQQTKLCAFVNFRNRNRFSFGEDHTLNLYNS